jgi:endonuclease YncB( thermonuclease family)
VSKHWKPGRQPVALRPSRIRREPVRLVESAARVQKAAASSREREMWGGVAGVLLIAAALVIVIVGVSVATILHDDPAADAQARQFGQCYNGGQNCVVDGNTIYVAGEKVEIAGVDAPQIQGARCPKERDRGIDTATRLAELLNRGNVTVSTSFREFGREVRKVELNGDDIAATMISTGMAKQRLGDQQQGWC